MDIIFCQCRAGQDLADSASDNISSFLLSLHQNADDYGTVSVIVVDDMCHWAAKEKVRLTGLTLSGSVTVIASCSPRAIASLLQYAGLDFPKESVINFMSYRELAESDIISQVRKIISDAGGVKEVIEYKLDYKPANMAWYPVLDSDLCTNCRQCENFCLFGVYGNHDGKVSVDKPYKCKPYCPACSRICTHSAVIFPKHDNPVINGNEFRENQTADNNHVSIKGNDLMAMLRNRGSLAEKAAQLDIPKQVIDEMTPEQLKHIIDKKNGK